MTYDPGQVSLENNILIYHIIEYDKNVQIRTIDLYHIFVQYFPNTEHTCTSTHPSISTLDTENFVIQLGWKLRV